MDPTGLHALSLYKVERQLQVYLQIPRLAGKVGLYSVQHPQQNLFTDTIKLLILNHVFVKKIQSADWSTEEAGAEGPLQICVGVFTQISMDQRSSTVLEVHNVELDSLLNQPAHERSAIGKIFVSATRSLAPTMALRLWRHC